MTPPSLPSENAYGHTKKLRFILDALGRQHARKGGAIRVLDFGCGNGAAVTQFLAGPHVDLHGVDIHPASLEYAKRNFGSDSLHFHSNMPRDLIFDAIVYADVLEHLDDPSSVLREHVLQLEPSGVVVGAVPNGYGPFEIEHKLERVFRLQQMVGALGGMRRKLRRDGERTQPENVLPYNHESGHLTFFTKSALKHCLSAAGLEITKFGHGSMLCGPWSTPLVSGRLSNANVVFADRLPFWAVSVWYFEARFERHSIPR